MTSLPAKAPLANSDTTEEEFQEAIGALRDAVAEMPGGTAPSALSISTGSCTPPAGSGGGSIIVDTESAAPTDDLANIVPTNAPDGRLLFVSAANAARVVTLKHMASGSGQLKLATSADTVLDATTKTVVFRFDLANDLWVEVIRSWNSTSVPLAGGSMTGALNWSKGADIASATTTDIGAATGNFVDVTGTTTITGFGTVQAGTVRFVRFTGALQITHHATSMILLGGANITTDANDKAIMVSLGSGNWLMWAYQRAGSMPAFVNIAQVWTKIQSYNPGSVSSVGGEITLDFTNTGVIQTTLTENITAITITGVPDGGQVRWDVKNHASAVKTVTGYPAAVEWVYGRTEPVMPAVVDAYMSVCFSKFGSDYLGSY